LAQHHRQRLPLLTDSTSRAHLLRRLQTRLSPMADILDSQYAPRKLSASTATPTMTFAVPQLASSTASKYPAPSLLTFKSRKNLHRSLIIVPVSGDSYDLFGSPSFTDQHLLSPTVWIAVHVDQPRGYSWLAFLRYLVPFGKRGM